MAMLKIGTTALSETHSTVSASLPDNILSYTTTGASIVARTNIFKTAGDYNFLVDLGNARANTYKEMTAPTDDVNPSVKNVLMRKIRIATQLEVSQKALAGDKDDKDLLDNHINKLMTDRVMREIEYQMFNSPSGLGVEMNTTSGFSYLANILKYGGSDLEPITSIGSLANTLSYDNLFQAYNEFATKQTDNLDGGIWVVKNLTAIGKVKDPSGKYIFTGRDLNSPAGSVGYVFGVPVYITPSFSETACTAVLINPYKAYAVAISKEAEIHEAERDTIQALKGSRIYVGEIYVSGKVVNPRAVVIVNSSGVAAV